MWLSSSADVAVSGCEEWYEGGACRGEPTVCVVHMPLARAASVL